MATETTNPGRFLSVRYGDGVQRTPLPASAQVTTVGRRRATRAADGDQLLARAVAAPLGAPGLTEFLYGCSRPLVVVNDATRSTPTAAILAVLRPALDRHPGWRVIVATGLHRAPTDPELQAIFGDTLSHVRSRLMIHDGYDAATLTRFEGEGGAVVMNRVLADIDRLIIIGSVEPHFFAGCTGGRKSLIPGLAGHETVARSHAGAVSEDAVPLRIDGNPVREFIHKNTSVLPRGRIWSIQVVLDRDDRIGAVFAGDIDKTFAMACVAARNLYVVPVTQSYDIVLAAIHPPLDVNLYQAQKGWELSCAGVRDNGVLIVTSPCREGVGSPFYERLSETFPNKGEWLSLAGQPYTMGLHKLVRTARICSRVRLMAVTGLPPEVVARYGYEGFGSLDDAMRAALGRTGDAPAILVVEDAALTTITHDFESD